MCPGCAGDQLKDITVEAAVAPGGCGPGRASLGGGGMRVARPVPGPGMTWPPEVSPWLLTPE